MKCGKGVCHSRSVVSLTVLSASLLLLSLISIISSERISKLPDYDSNTDLDPTYSNSETNFIEKIPLKQNFDYLKGIMSKRANIRYLRNVLDALDNKLERFQKRTCYINAGMTHNCDFKDLISAMNARRFWESTHSPGRRKRNTILPVHQLLKTSPLPVQSEPH